MYKTKKFSSAIMRIYILLFISILYVIFTLGINKKSLGPTPVGYYNPLIDALLHGRVNIFFPHHFDLSWFRGKWYMYWGPAPVVFILPFFFAGGLFASDITYVLIAGIANIFMFDLVLHTTKTYFHISLSFISELLLLFSFAIVSPNFYLSLSGNVWATEQLVGIFYLLLFYYFYFCFLIKKRVWYLILSVIFFNLAWLSRYILIFHGILFLFFIDFQRLIHPNDDRPLDEADFRRAYKKEIMRFIFYIVSISSIFILIFFLYNYAKFGNIFETGLRYHQGASRYLPIMRRNEIFSYSYVWHNTYYFFFNLPQFSFHMPFFRIDREGNSVFFVYPCILFLIFLYTKIPKLNKKNRYFLFLAGVIIAIILLALLFYFATGWTQFGMRFFLDIVPLVYLLLIFIINDIPKYITIPVLIYGCIIQFFGTLYFYIR